MALKKKTSKASAKKASPKKKAAKRRTKAVRRTYREMFLDKLKELTTSDRQLVPNRDVRDGLAWDDGRYDRIKAQLSDEGLIIVGRGYGGRVGLRDAPGTSPLKVFISYSHIDEKIKNDLQKHLSPLKRMDLISEWSDREIKAGDDWGSAISKQLEQAHIIILLISIDFINSKYCYDIEMDKALERHEDESAVVIPVIVRNCLWQHTPFAKLQAVPKDGRAVASYADLDTALTEVTEAIRTVAESLRRKN